MSKSDEIYKYTVSKLKYLQDKADTGTVRGIMANLRRGVGKPVGELPEVWGIVFDKISPELLGKNQASNAEWAIYTALTLYAVHQQGSDTSINQEKISLGHASARLIKTEDDTDRILKRLNLVVTAVSPEDLAYRLKEIIQLLKQENIPLDYAKLAEKLYLFCDEKYAQNVKLQWGRDFWSERNRLEKKESENNG
ncbi:MAG: type I-E CRISPR-associated protein Cse2/CasB [Oscillospiraceae bacterium]